jgi:hypothetical protein
MACFFDHNWGWPRKRGDKDIQVCLSCGTERESKVHFDGPRYHRTQTGAGEPRLRVASSRTSEMAEMPDYSSVAA